MYEKLYTKETETTIDVAVNNAVKTTGMDRNELLGAAHDTFMLCAGKFDPERKIKFHTFLSRSLGWKLYEYARTGKINGRRGRTAEKYGIQNQKDEMKLYDMAFGESNVKDYNREQTINLETGTVFCGREIKNWREQEDDLLVDITFQSMSRDARTVYDEIVFNHEKIMENNFRPRWNRCRQKSKEAAIYDYFHDQGWDKYRITTAFREIRENLKAA